MSEFDILALCLFCFWTGQRSVRHALKKQQPDMHPSWLDMTKDIGEGMRWVRNAHRFAGDEVCATKTTVYRVSGLGKFKVTVERLEGETIEGHRV